ncbi:MAG: TldD/PmbA family protein [Clostridia bacterium]|nr:TldD/PmbA family protein [Clostridia bacterium]
MINSSIISAVLYEALKTGGDFSELYLEDTEQNSLSMIDGKLQTANYQRKVGAGVRVLKGTRSAYACCNSLNEESLLSAARAAAAAFKGAREYETTGFSVDRIGVSCAKIPFSEINNQKRIDMLKLSTDAAKAYSNEISQVVVNYMDCDRRTWIYNSEGLHAEDRRPRTRLALQAVATANGEAQVGSLRPGYGMGFEAYAEKVDLEYVGRHSAEIAVTMLHAPECPSGAVPVVIDGGFGGIILHEACVHSLESSSVGRGNSVFCDKLGQRIASDIVTAVDDGTLPGEWGSMNYDDEGSPAQRNVLIENGVLKSYLVDRLGSRLMDMPVTGSARRQDYTYAPVARMTNTFIAEGTDDEDEMIASVPEGLFAVRMGGGSVDTLTGSFNFAVNEGYWVRNGQIVCPVRGATLIGKGADVLMKIDRIGRKMWMETGICGSFSGSIPTNVGQPRIRVSEITVGGKRGSV